MQQGLKGSIAGVVAAATLLAGGILTVPHAMALEADGQYYSSKQPYVAPSEATTASYSQAPEGYETVYTESMARHGSRGLSSYKYDALLMKMAEAAEADNGFKSDAIKSEFMKNLKAITAANVENGYGMLTGQGADQHQGIGARAYERNKTLFDNAAKDGDKIAYQSSGEARATESGENFARGFNAASNNKLANSTVTPADPAGTGEAALAALKANPDIKVALLDIMLPDIDGFEVCRRIRAMDNKIGIIMLTARTQEMDKVTGLMTGADDYVTKPFSPAELTARVDALFRRTGGGEEEASPDEIVEAPFRLNTRNRTLEKNGQRVKLTQVEYGIVKLFMENPGKALSREEILDAVWGKDYFGELKIVDVNIRRLRIKIEDNPTKPTYVNTVWGYGYKWGS